MALRPASPAELTAALADALAPGGKPLPQAGALMAAITAAHLAEQLQRHGFRLMRGPDAAAPTTSGHPHPSGRNEARPGQG